MKKQFLILILICVSLLVNAQSPYISKVFAYHPAPGQFIGEHYPDVYADDTYETILARVDAALSGAIGNAMITLGAWGGSVTFGFDHDIQNRPGERDLLVYGNVYFTGEKVDGHAVSSSEPGIIWVSQDANGNGLPDDPWYEIAGSATAQAIRDYQVTYYYSTEDIQWVDNKGNTGSIKRNSWHQQDTYFPYWESMDSLVISGTLLPPNMYDKGNGVIRSVAYDYGYADNQPNDSLAAQIDLDWAVDAEGQPVHLDAIRFVKVQTGVQVDWGISGEMSTELCGAADLHIATSLTDRPLKPKAEKRIRNGQLVICIGDKTYDILGKRL